MMNLPQLAPDIQEEILFLPATERGPDVVTERELRPIEAFIDWKIQRREWKDVSDSPINKCHALLGHFERLALQRSAKYLAREVTHHRAREVDVPLSNAPTACFGACAGHLVFGIQFSDPRPSSKYDNSH